MLQCVHLKVKALSWIVPQPSLTFFENMYLFDELMKVVIFPTEKVPKLSLIH